MKELIPLNENVLVELQTAETKTKGGIILPESVNEDNPHIGLVLAIGNVENPEIAVGDKVIFKKFSGTDLEFEKKKYIVVTYSDILVKIVETEEI